MENGPHYHDFHRVGVLMTVKIVQRFGYWLSLLLLLLSGGAQVQAAAPACPSGSLIIGTDATFPPFTSKVGEQYVGLEIELGEQLAAALGCQVQWVNSSFDGIFPALLSGKYDFVIASVTITEERKKSLLFSEPYVDAGQAIATRRADPAITTLEGLYKRKVGVGLNTTGQFLLEPHTEIQLVKFPSVDLALSDLANGRLDAAVGDGPVFKYMIHQNFSALRLHPTALNQEQWGMVFRPGTEPLLQQVNEKIRAFKADGSLKKLEAKYLGGEVESPAEAGEVTAAPEQGPRFRLDRLLEALPLMFTAARWTLFLALGAFVLGVPLGLLVALMRLSPLAFLRAPAAAYVELLRGTPLLVQIFFIYFVLPGVGIRLNDTTTAILALSVNASAYISEIFRAGLLSLDHGQREAAEALGLTRSQSLRYVLVPQAFRRVVPPLTNECIALIKDSSLVSVMGMTELTRTGQELASRYADPLTFWPGIALTYFLLTFPLTRLSAWLELRLSAGQVRHSEDP